MTGGFAGDAVPARAGAFAALALMLAAAGCARDNPRAAAERAAADAARVPAARPVGEARLCIPLAGARRSFVRSDSVIDFESGGQLYRNTLPRPCPRLGFERAFAYATSLSQLCNVDTITVISPSVGLALPGPTCGLGRFQPIRLIERRR